MPFNRAAPTSTINAASRSTRTKQLWRQFEQWLSSPRATMENERIELLRQMDLEWRKLPIKSRPKKHEHEATKLAARRRLERDFYVPAREEWMRRLEEVGLVPEDWDDITAQETAAVERALGTDAYDDEGPDTAEDISKAVQLYAPPTQPSVVTLDPAPTIAPVLTVATRSANSSGSYRFVNPKDFGRDDEPSAEDDLPFNLPGMENVVSVPSSVSTSSGLSTALRWGREINPQLTIRCTDIPAISGPTSSTIDTMDPRTPKASSVDHAPTPEYPRMTQPSRSPSKRSPDDQWPASVRQSPVAGPACVGPVLIDPDETLEEDEDFENFKLAIRKTKIMEFHQAAAEAEVHLITTLFYAQKDKWGFIEQARLAVHHHENKMRELRAKKEEERLAIVEDERQRRWEQVQRKAITLDAHHSPTRQAWSSGRPPSSQEQEALEEQIADDLAREMSFALQETSTWEQGSELSNFYTKLGQRERKPPSPPQVQPRRITPVETSTQPSALGSVFGFKQIRNLFGGQPGQPPESQPSTDYQSQLPLSPLDQHPPPVNSIMKPKSASAFSTWTTKSSDHIAGSESRIDGLPPPSLSSNFFTKDPLPPVTQNMWKPSLHQMEADGLSTPIGSTKAPPLGALETTYPDLLSGKAPLSKKQRAKAKKGQVQPSFQAEGPSNAIDPPLLQHGNPHSSAIPVVEPEFDGSIQAFTGSRFGDMQHGGMLSSKQMTKADTMKAGLSKIQIFDSASGKQPFATLRPNQDPFQAPLSSAVVNSPITSAHPTKTGWRTVGHAATSTTNRASLSTQNHSQYQPPSVGNEFWVPNQQQPPQIEYVQDSIAEHGPTHQVWNTNRPRGFSSPPQFELGPTTDRRLAPQNNQKATSMASASASTSAWTSSSSTSAKKSKAKSTGKGKAAVTVEEVSDEEGPDGHGIEERLPPNSRVILEPRPSKPAAAFSSIYSYSEDDEEDEDTGLSSFAATPSTAPTSPGGMAPWSDEWIAATLSAGSTEWSKKFGVDAPKNAKVSPPAPPAQPQAKREQPVPSAASNPTLNGKHIYWGSGAQSAAVPPTPITEPMTISKSTHRTNHSSFAPSSLSSSFGPGIGSQSMGSFVGPSSVAVQRGGFAEMDLDDPMPGGFPSFTNANSSSQPPKTFGTASLPPAGKTNPAAPTKSTVSSDVKDQPKVPVQPSKPAPAPAPVVIEKSAFAEKPAQKGKTNKANARKGNMRNKSAV